ncbi:MAG: DMT family transporter [Candidatus Methylomirabilia bacterium]
MRDEKGWIRLLAIAQGLLVSGIWASSFVIIKIGLAHVAPLTLAGMRYFTAFLLLLPWMALNAGFTRNPAPGQWRRLFLMGLCAYPLSNGALFWGLQYVPATTGAFLFSLLPLPSLLLALVWLREVPTRLQVVGLTVALAGSALFFSPGLSVGDPLALGVISLGVLAFGVFVVLGRALARAGQVSTLPLTALPLGFGGGLLLLVALPLERAASPSLEGWAAVLWLAVVNTALAYFLYNRCLRTLTVLESNVLLSLSPLGTALLASLLLGERVVALQVIGLVVAILGVLLVQWRFANAEGHQGEPGSQDRARCQRGAGPDHDEC